MFQSYLEMRLCQGHRYTAVAITQDSGMSSPENLVAELQGLATGTWQQEVRLSMELELGAGLQADFILDECVA